MDFFLSELCFDILVFGPLEAVGFEVADVFEFFVELLLHFVPDFDFFAIFGEGEGDPFELVFRNDLGLVHFAAQQLCRLVADH